MSRNGVAVKKAGVSEGLLIGDLAGQSGVPPKTIRFYEEVDLLPHATRGKNGYRHYSADDVERLRFIRSARLLDFSIDDLREVLALREQGEAPCQRVAELLITKASEVEERIQQLRELQRELQELLILAEGLPDDDIEMKQCVCHLIRIHNGAS